MVESVFFRRDLTRSGTVEFHEHAEKLAPDVDQGTTQSQSTFACYILSGIRLLATLSQAFTGTCNRKAMGVEQVLDTQQLVYVLAGVDALAFARLLGANRPKFGLPVPQHVGFHTYDVRNLPDAIVQLDRRWA
jgi:hypothetical protein